MAVTGHPLLASERLELWQPARDDIAAMHAIVSHAATRRYLGPADSRAEHYQRFSRNAGSWWLYGYGAFMVRLKSTGELIGNCGVFHSWRGLGDDFDDKPEAGWILRHDQEGQGLAYEAVSAALAWFEREHGPREIVAMITPGNARSFALAARLGFEPFRDAVLPDGEPITLLRREPAG